MWSPCRALCEYLFDSSMRIRQLAEATHVTVDALRHYEKLGLLPPAARSDNGYRRYGPADVLRVLVIRFAQGLGFTLSELRDIVPELSSGQMTQRAVQARLGDKLNVLDAEIERLQTLRAKLAGVLAELDCAPDVLVNVSQAARAVQPPQRTRMPGVAPGQGFST